MSICLRPFAATDLASLRLLFGEAGTRLWNPGPDDAGVDAWWRESNDGASSPDFRTWAVADADSGRLLGTVSVFGAAAGEAEIGVRVLHGDAGRGVATAAMTAAARRAAAELGLGRLRLVHAVDNPASCRVAAKLGFGPGRTVAGAEPYGDGLLHDEHVHWLELSELSELSELR